MISDAQLRQYVAQSGAERSIALQEIALTYVLAAIYEQPWSAQLAFKGGTALRKLLFGAHGRFSVDLDFLAAGTSDEDVLQIAHDLDGLEFHGLRVSLDGHRFTSSDPDHFGRPSPEGFSADCGFESAVGSGGFGLDISRRRSSFTTLARRPLQSETYHRYLEFPLPEPLALALEEAAAEKVSALARRMDHGNAKDVYDLFLYLPRPQRQPLLARLIALTLWSDRRAIGDPAAFVARITPDTFRWEELAGLLPRRQLVPDTICATVRAELERVFTAMIPGESALVADAGTHRDSRLFAELSAHPEATVPA